MEVPVADGVDVVSAWVRPVWVAGAVPTAVAIGSIFEAPEVLDGGMEEAVATEFGGGVVGCCWFRPVAGQFYA